MRFPSRNDLRYRLPLALPRARGALVLLRHGTQIGRNQRRSSRRRGQRNR